MGVKTIRRMAADILKVGENRIKFEPTQLQKIEEALTREDVRSLIDNGTIIVLPKLGVGKGRARKRAEQKRKGRRRGYGSRRGTKSGRADAKEEWMVRVRSLRITLGKLKDDGKVNSANARKLYLMIKGRAFRGIANMLAYIKENKLGDIEDKPKKSAKAKKAEKQ